MQIASLLRRIMLSFVACLSVWMYHIFPLHLIHNAMLERHVLSIKHVIWFSLHLLPENFLILRRMRRDMIISLHGSSCKVISFRVKFYYNLIFPTDFRKNSYILNVTKVRPVETEMFHADGQMDGQTDMTQLTVAFLNFVNANNVDSY
jgi:hypothetical protein